MQVFFLKKKAASIYHIPSKLAGNSMSDAGADDLGVMQHSKHHQ